MLAIFGPGAKELIFSGDAVADQQRRARFVKAYDEKNRLVQQGNDMILVIGKEDWPFPIPVMKKGDGWVFDIARGREEILNRRIGENELNTIQVCRAIVDAQREYAMKDRDKNGLLEYAQKFRSDPGKKNGLYWDSKAGEPQSPLGPITVQARGEGYQGRDFRRTVPLSWLLLQNSNSARKGCGGRSVQLSRQRKNDRRICAWSPIRRSMKTPA